MKDLPSQSNSSNSIQVMLPGLSEVTMIRVATPRATRLYLRNHKIDSCVQPRVFSSKIRQDRNDDLLRQAGGNLNYKYGQFTRRATFTSSAAAFGLVSLAAFLFWNPDANLRSSVPSKSQDLRILENPSVTCDRSVGGAAPPEEGPPSNITFIYSRLSSAEKTRLLILEPGELEDEILCRLKHVESLRDHDYEALSYFWGDDDRTCQVNCAGKSIKVTPNLDVALRQLRHLDGPRFLWVDAVCINQDDILEKTQQVRIMQEIYANAREVVIWLGKNSSDDALAFNALRELRSRLIQHDNARSAVRLGWYRDKSGSILTGGDSILENLQYRHIIQLLRREWFHRTWIIQEVASAKSAVVRCGDQSMPWATLAEVCMQINDHFLPVSQLGGELAQQSLENIAAIETARRSNSGSLAMPLFHILVATSFSKCKEPGDKIIAVAGLAKDGLQKAFGLPDYNATGEKIFETFKSFAIEDVNQNGDLRTLSCPPGPNQVHGLPSWAPDWTNIQNPHPFVRYSDRTRFQASGGIKAVSWHSASQKILHVTGKMWDSIEVLGSEPRFAKACAVFEINETKIEELKSSSSWIQECYKLASDEKGTMSPNRYAEFWKTMTCGLTGEGFPAPKRYSWYLFQYLKFLDSVPERFEGYMIEGRSLPDGFRGSHEITDHWERYAVIEESIYRWASRRRFCVTRHGQLAFVPKDSTKGDIICVLFGGEVPYVLRPLKDGSYVVVGECYQARIMNGESLSHDAASRVFRLR